MRVLWSPLAIQRAAEVSDYIAQDRPMAADRWVDRLFESVERLGDFPQSGRVVPEVGERDLRELLVGGYRVFYRISRNEVRVLTVRHGRRLLDESEFEDDVLRGVQQFNHLQRQAGQPKNLAHTNNSLQRTSGESG